MHRTDCLKNSFVIIENRQHHHLYVGCNGFHKSNPFKAGDSRKSKRLMGLDCGASR